MSTNYNKKLFVDLLNPSPSCWRVTASASRLGRCARSRGSSQHAGGEPSGMGPDSMDFQAIVPGSFKCRWPQPAGLPALHPAGRGVRPPTAWPIMSLHSLPLPLVWQGPRVTGALHEPKRRLNLGHGCAPGSWTAEIFGGQGKAGPGLESRKGGRGGRA